MAPGSEEERLQPSDGPGSRRDRTRARAAAVQARARKVAERAEAERGRHGSVDAVFEMADRDIEAGGGIIAGALAFRLFIWMLPMALVAVAGLGIASRAESESPERAAHSVGLGGLVSSSVAHASEGKSWWYALLVGIPVLLIATRSVLRVLIGAHRLIWADVRAAAPRPKLGATARLLVLLVCFYAFSGVGAYARAQNGSIGVIGTLVVSIPYAGLWLLISVRLPHRSAGWRDLVPGAIVFGVGIEAVNVLAAYLIGPYALEKQGTYGALGIAAAILLGLFIVSRLVVFTAVINVTLWERRARRADRA